MRRPVGDWGQVHAGSVDFKAAEHTSSTSYLPDSGTDDVVVVRVSELLESAAAIKIDVEGSEAAAMRSCESLLFSSELQLATVEFHGKSDVEYSESMFEKLLQGGMSAYIFQEEYFRFTPQHH